MVEGLEQFISKVDGFNGLSASEKCDYFVYYLTEFKELPGVKPKQVETCFNELKIRPSSNISRYLRTNSKRKNGISPKFFIHKELYLLDQKRKEEIRATVHIDKPFIETNKTLRSILTYVKNKSEQEFLDEAIKAFEVEAFRAAIVLVWLLTIDHLYEYILAHKLTDFNEVLARNTDRRVRISAVVTKDDFSDIPEGKFIEFCRSAGVISGDVRKVLDEKLGTRNSAAHPSNIKIGRGKVFDFIEDLVNNVIVKFKV
jgi:hypothetical protein